MLYRLAVSIIMTELCVFSMRRSSVYRCLVCGSVDVRVSLPGYLYASMYLSYHVLHVLEMCKKIALNNNTLHLEVFKRGGGRYIFQVYMTHFWLVGRLVG